MFCVHCTALVVIYYMLFKFEWDLIIFKCASFMFLNDFKLDLHLSLSL